MEALGVVMEAAAGMVVGIVVGAAKAAEDRVAGAWHKTRVGT